MGYGGLFGGWGLAGCWVGLLGYLGCLSLGHCCILACMNELLLLLFPTWSCFRLVGFGFGFGFGFCGLARLPVSLSIYPLILSSAMPTGKLRTETEFD